MNIVMLSGKLGQDPELKDVGKTKLCSFSLACDRKGKDGDAVTMWIEIKAWGSIAETLASQAKKGSEIVVKGTLNTESWIDKATEAKRNKTVVVAQSLEVFDIRTNTKKLAIPDEEPIPF